MSLIQVSHETWVDPKYTRIALMTNATEPDRRHIWVVSKATPDLGIEVETRFQGGLLKALGVDVGAIARAID